MTHETVCSPYGDLVASEAVEAPDLLHAGFNSAINRENAKWRKQIAAPLTITLGDEFQGLLPSLTATLPVLRDLRLDLLASASTAASQWELST